MLKNFFLSLLFFLLFPVWVQGAVLYLEPSGGEFQAGDAFIVEVKIDSEKECINAVEAELKFSQEVLEAIDFSQGLSILTLWVKSLEINQESGLISFAGGIPGGYCGEIPGDPGPHHLIGKIAFQAEQGKEAKIEFLERTQVLLNDGFGTPAKLKTKGAVFKVSSGKGEPSKDEWQELLKNDTIPPELFEIEIHQDSNIFEGKYFIVFPTTDKQTGVDYYEVKEGEKDWKRVESPYLLEDQALQSIIKVRAMDKAGNERITEYIPPGYKPPEKLSPYLIITLVLAGTGLIIWIAYKILEKK